MNEQHAQGPEQYIVPSQKELYPGETARSLEQNTEHPLKSAEEMCKLTGLDLPATMAIEFNEGPETHQLLVVPIERGKNEDYDADFLLVNPNLMAPDGPDDLATNIGFKGLRVHEGVKFGAGDDNINERVNARLGLHAGTSPNFRMQVDDKGNLHISVNPNSPQKIRLVQPVLYERHRGQPEVPAHIEQPLALAEAPETTEELSTNEVFKSSDSFLATLENPDLSQVNRTELIKIMSYADERQNVKYVTELWKGRLGEAMAELAPDAQKALTEAATLDAYFTDVHSAARELSELLDIPNDAYRVPGIINKLQAALDQLTNQLQYAQACDTFLQKAGELPNQRDKNVDQAGGGQTEHGDMKSAILKAFEQNTVLQDHTKLDALIEEHVPEEKLGQMRLRLENQLKQEPGYDTWRARREALERVMNVPSYMSNQDFARQLEGLNRDVRSNPDAINYFLYQLAPSLRDKLQDTSQRAHGLAYVT